MNSQTTENKLVLANWKANFSPQRARDWCEAFASAYRPVEGVEVVIAVPFLCMQEVGQLLGSLNGIELASQGVSAYPQGSYTGSTPAAWLQGLAKYTLIGHRERRHYFHEGVQDVAKQVYESLAEELIPIVCIDRDNVQQQTAIFDTADVLRIRWAYTPKDAEQLERAHGDHSIEQAVAGIAPKVGQQLILYGGGVNQKNSSQIFTMQGVGGILLGRGCLDPLAFASLISALPSSA